MKNYLYYFKFGSGTYTNDFYQQLYAKNMQEALCKIYAEFCEMTVENAVKYLKSKLGNSWDENDFWNNIEFPVFSSGMTEAYELYFVKEIKFSLNKI